MNELSDFQQQIQSRILGADDAKRRCQHERERRQIDLDRRIEEFRSLGDRIVSEIVRPRMAAVADNFDNATLSGDAQTSPHVVTIRLERCDRFPASTILTFTVSHDSEVESLVISYDLEILPVFVKFAGHDQKFFPLATLDECEVSAWVESKLMEFVDTYLSLEMTPAYQHDNLVVDPVCGSTITRNCAVAHEEYAGSKIYFCSDHCHAKFIAAPESFRKI